MQSKLDIRWKQRLQNYQRAFAFLHEFYSAHEQRELNKLEEQGLIQAFEYTHELAWNLMKDYLTSKGIEGIIGSRDSIRIAFANGIISNGQIWMDMIKSRNISSHSYDEVFAEALSHDILEKYYPEFLILRDKFVQLSQNS